MRELGKTVFIWVVIVSLLCVSAALTLALLQIREATIATEHSVDGLVCHAHAVLTGASTASVDLSHKTGLLLTTATGSARKLNKALDAVSAKCVPGPCGTLADINKTLGTVRGTFGQIEIAANHEDKNLTTLDNQEAALFSDAHTTLNGMQPLEINASKAVEDFDAAINDPAWHAILANSQEITLQGAGILKDGRIEADKFIAPTSWYKRGWNYIFQGGTLAWDFLR